MLSLLPSRSVVAASLLLVSGTLLSRAAIADLPGDRMLSAYFEDQTTRVNAQAYANVKTLGDWTRERETYREQLQEMLGLLPYPARTDMKPTITGRLEHPEFYVEKLHFQSMPGLYVTGNLYVPKNITGKLPAILYVCGHARVEEKGVNFGNKTAYQHHGAWYARHGYVCLTIDTIQLGELSGLHHGTHREGMFWWNSRGYTPVGVEAWNSMRALDYLQSRPEVDGNKLGMTGRSGGGSYSWYTAALDERVKAVVPVAGITDLRNHVIDGCVAGHCDCMYMVNTFRWDYSKLAALIAPRPLLIANSDKDRIFPLDGVVRVHAEVAAIYSLYKASDKLGLLITEGPHKDTQDLQVPTFRWFNRFLRGQEPLISVAAEKFFKPADLRVFTTLPPDERTTKAHEFFVPAAAPAVPANRAEWTAQKEGWRTALQEKSFAGWPAAGEPVNATQLSQESSGAMTLTTWEFTTQGAVRLPLLVFSGNSAATLPARSGADAKLVRLHVLDEQGWAELAASVPPQWRAHLGLRADAPVSQQAPSAHHRELFAQVERGEITLAYLPPRGVGPTQWSGDERAKTHVLRRYMLLGQTLEGMRVWDIRRAIETVRQPAVVGPGAALQLAGERYQAVNALYASLFTDSISSLELIAPPASHHTGPDYLNVLRFLDVPQAVAVSAEQRPVKITRGNPDDWSWARNTARRLEWPADRLQW